MGGWVLRMTWGLEACFAVFHSESAFALSLLTVWSLWGTQGWLGVGERVVWAVGYIQQFKAHLKSRSGICWWVSTVHIEDFTRARVNESDLTAVLVETGAIQCQSRLNHKIQPFVVEGVVTHSKRFWPFSFFKGHPRPPKPPKGGFFQVPQK